MSNVLYAAAKQSLLRGEIDVVTANIRAALITNNYALNATTHTSFANISAFVVSTPQSLINKTATNGVFDADDVTFTAVPAGSTLGGVVLYVDHAVPSSARLLAHISTIAGFPLATNGGNITIQWDNGAFRIFSL